MEKTAFPSQGGKKHPFHLPRYTVPIYKLSPHQALSLPVIPPSQTLTVSGLFALWD